MKLVVKGKQGEVYFERYFILEPSDDAPSELRAFLSRWYRKDGDAIRTIHPPAGDQQISPAVAQYVDDYGTVLCQYNVGELMDDFGVSRCLPYADRLLFEQQDDWPVKCDNCLHELHMTVREMKATGRFNCPECKAVNWKSKQLFLYELEMANCNRLDPYLDMRFLKRKHQN